MKVTSAPHDKIFKQFLTNLDTARAFLKVHLPPAFLKVCRLDTLKLVSGSFIDMDQRELRSDIYYSMKTVTGNSNIYCVIEHQSSPHRHMPYRMLRYVVAGMQPYYDARHEQLPLVIPILFYHGRKRPYPNALHLRKELNVPSLAVGLYNSGFLLVDVTAISDSEIMKHKGVALLEFMQKNIFQRDFSAYFEQLVTLLQSDYYTEGQRTASIEYILRAGDTTDPTSFIRMLVKALPQDEELIMTMAQRFKLEGRQEEVRRIARALLHEGVHASMVRRVTGLSQSELKRLHH